MSAATRLQPTANEVQDLLGWLSPDVPRNDWFSLLAAVKAALGDDGFEIADKWSQGSDKYRAADMLATWRSIRPGGGITAATLYHMAKAAGWRPPAPTPGKVPQEPPRRAQKPVQRPQEPPGTFAYAVQIWARARREDRYVAGHPYAVRKHITHAAGAGRAAVSGRLLGKEADCLVVPYRTLAGELVGVECINAEGAKQTFGKKGALILGNDLDRAAPILVLEGWASAVHALNAYNWSACAIVAGGKHRLERVAAELVKLHPARKIIICEEDDRHGG